MRPFRFSTLLAGAALLLSGCASLQPAPPSAPVDSGAETVVFIATADRVDVVDAATAVLVAHDFTITLANERLGLLQTDYASVSAIEAMRADSGRGDPALRDLYVRITVNADDRGEETLVQIKGSFQRMGTGTAPDRVLGLYWMERLAGDMAQRVDAEFVPGVSADMYHQALENAALPVASDRRTGLSRGLRAAGIVGAILFAATLLANTLAPSGGR